jgi:hypothetical protein
VLKPYRHEYDNTDSGQQSIVFLYYQLSRAGAGTIFYPLDSAELLIAGCPSCFYLLERRQINSLIFLRLRKSALDAI